MAIKRNERYPGRFQNPSADYPQGAFKNRSSPTSQDGSYLEKDWANDWDGFFAALLTSAGITPNGNVDTASSSQYFDALGTITNGKLLAVKTITTSGTYTKPANVKKLRVRVLGGGGAGGGTTTTTASQIASGAGGNGGSFGDTGLFDASSINTVSVTVGAGGVAAPGGNGGAGGSTSFGTYITAPGGAGGVVGPGGPAPSTGADNVAGSPCTGSSVFTSVRGKPGSAAVNLSLSSLTIRSGRGGDSILGSGGGSVIGGSSGIAGSDFGAGGSGASAGPSTSSTQGGGNGSPGICIIEEYY